ncbi:MAG: tetratricopeptide repeat protein [Verrucomicrobiales bacterium]
MRASVKELYSELERAPEDWSVRLRLVEVSVDSGAFEEAKRLVRTAPDEGPLPKELQNRIHELLSRKETPADIAKLPRAKDS